MMKVLFVDDEPNILSGLRRMLRGMRHEWDMDFVDSGAEALKLLDQDQWDVVVSDMRMPAVDGTAVLSAFRKRNPSTIRIALSGETEQCMIYRCVQHAHQYLAKPCDADTLVETVQRAGRLKAMISNPELGHLVTGMSSLPSLPDQYQQIMDELQSDDASLQKIGEIIESDVAMTAKILQLVNSSFFGLIQHVSSPAQAAMFLGVDVIRSLVLTSGVFSQFDSEISRALNLDSIWTRSTRVGALAKRIAIEETGDKLLADYALMSGMLMDIGILVLAQNKPEQLKDTFARAREQGTPEWEAEREDFGHSHTEVGAYLAGVWGLPNPIIECIAYHHTPTEQAEERFSALAAVHVALGIVDAHDTGDTPEIDGAYLDKLGVAERLPEWQAIYRELLEEEASSS